MNQSLKEFLITLAISSVFLTPVIFLKIIAAVMLMLILGRIWGNIVRQVLRTRYGVMTWILGMYIVLSLTGFFASMVVVWYSLYGLLIMIPIILTISLTYFIAYLWDKKRGDIFYFPSVSCKKLFKASTTAKLLSTGVIVLSALALYLMSASQSSDILWSPWQVLSAYIPWIYIAVMLLLAWIIHVSRNVRLIVFLFIIFSFVIHAYIPLAHVMPWGGDVWRHIAVEQKMIDGGFELPVLFGEHAIYSDIGIGFPMPEALIIPHKYSYGNLWGTSILISDICGIDLQTLNKWLVPVMWSLIMPLILFLLGRVLYRSPRRALWFLWLTSGVFILQSIGGFTLPVSFGLPIFLIGLLLWLYYMKRRDHYIRNAVYGLTVLMIFGYTLYFVLMVLVIVMSFLLRRISSRVGRAIVAGVSLLYFPLVELVTYTSRIGSVDVWHNTKQMIGTMSGLFFALMIRPHDIIIGNIFFNHTPERAHLIHIFTSFRWHIVIMMVIMWALFAYGLWYIFFKKKNKLWTLIGTLAISVTGGYIFSWTFLDGDHMFVRRLDSIIALFVLAVVFYIWSRLTAHRRRRRIFSIVAVFLVVWFGVTAYLSGPDMRIVSADEYAIAETIFAEVEDGEDVCVLGDTWMLLALEGVSSESIKAGNFPLGYQFGQPDRVRLYEELLIGNVIVDEIYDISDRDTCTLVAPKDEIDIEEKMRIDEELDTFGVGEYGFYRWLIKNEK